MALLLRRRSRPKTPSLRSSGTCARAKSRIVRNHYGLLGPDLGSTPINVRWHRPSESRIAGPASLGILPATFHWLPGDLRVKHSEQQALPLYKQHSALLVQNVCLQPSMSWMDVSIISARLASDFHRVFVHNMQCPPESVNWSPILSLISPKSCHRTVFALCVFRCLLGCLGVFPLHSIRDWQTAQKLT